MYCTNPILRVSSYCAQRAFNGHWSIRRVHWLEADAWLTPVGARAHSYVAIMCQLSNNSPRFFLPLIHCESFYFYSTINITINLQCSIHIFDIESCQQVNAGLFSLTRVHVAARHQVLFLLRILALKAFCMVGVRFGENWPLPKGTGKFCWNVLSTEGKNSCSCATRNVRYKSRKRISYCTCWMGRQSCEIPKQKKLNFNFSSRRYQTETNIHVLWNK